MKHVHVSGSKWLPLFLLAATQTTVNAIDAGDFRSNAPSGKWSQAATWEVYDGKVWKLSNSIPDSSHNVLIKANNKISIDTAASCKNLMFSNNLGNSQIDFNKGNGTLAIFGNAEFRDGVNSISTWIPGARLLLKGGSDQVLSTGSAARFLNLEINKTGGVVTQAGGTTLRIEQELVIAGKSSVILTCNLEGLLFKDGITPSLPTVLIEHGAALDVKGSVIMRSGSSGTSPIGNLLVYGSVNLTSTSPTGLNYNNVIVGNGYNPGLLHVSGAWLNGAYTFSSLTLNNNAVYQLSATSIGKVNHGSTLFNKGSGVIYSENAASNLPFADTDYFNLTLHKSTQWNLSVNRNVYGYFKMAHECTLTISGPEGLSADLKKLTVAGNFIVSDSAVLKLKHANLLVVGDMILENGFFEGGSSSASTAYSGLHHFSKNIRIEGGSMKLTVTDSDPMYEVDGDILLNNAGVFIGTAHAGGVPSLFVEGGINTCNNCSFQASDGIVPNTSTLLKIEFSNKTMQQKKSTLSLRTGLSGYASLWRFTISSGRCITLQSDVELGGDTVNTAFTSFEVQPFATLYTSQYAIKSAVQSNGTRFIMNSDATLSIGHSEGITLYPSAMGAVQTTMRKYLSTAHYEYNGTYNQSTGDGLPAIIRNLTIRNTGQTGNNNVLLSNSNLSVGSDTCKILQGVFDVGNHTLGGAGNLVMRGGVLKISKISDVLLLPELGGDYDLAAGKIALTGNGTQIIRGNRSYYNLHLSGSNVQGISFKHPSSSIIIHNMLELTDSVILDAVDISGNAVTINGPGGLRMLGETRFRMKKLNATLPELTATNPGTDYILEGGTIELYGSDAMQSHSLNGSKGSSGADITYFNVELNAHEKNSTDANVVLQSSISVSNNFIVNAPVSFQISNMFSIKGGGNFLLKSGATFQYGSPDGISSISNTGNIRVKGKRLFPSDAHYGFIGGVEMVSGDLLPDTIGNLFIRKSNATQCTLSKHLHITDNLKFKSGKIKSQQNAMLVIHPEAVATDASDTSFVEGPVMKKGNAAFTFPVGMNSSYRPISIAAPQKKEDTFTAQYYAMDPLKQFGSTKDSMIDHTSTCEYWQLDRVKGISRVAVSLSWDENSCGVDNLQDLRVVKWDGQKWKNYGNARFTGMPIGGTITSDPVEAFSPFTLASVSTTNPLPVTILSFDAKYMAEQVNLVWVTGAEINNDYFTIEKSTDGLSYFTVATVKGGGTSFRKISYHYTDTEDMEGTVYYRLKQTDFNGDSIYTDSISVMIREANNFSIEKLYIKNDLLMLSLNDDEHTKKSVRVFDFIGKELFSTESDALNFEIPLNNLIHDCPYLVRISNGREIIRRFYY